MSSAEDIGLLSREELLVLVTELQRQVLALQAQVAQLAADNQELRAEVDRLTRQSKRQVTPFSKGTRSNQPKSPGRKPGEGTFSFRRAPRPEEISESDVNVPVARESCPGCGDKLQEHRVDFAYITELPPLAKPRVTQYRVWVCRCTRCGRRVRGEHPDLAPDQYGATAHRLGPRAMAAALALHYQVGIPERPDSIGVPLVLGLLTGMALTQGAIPRTPCARPEARWGRSTRNCRPGSGSPQWCTPTTPAGR